MIRVLVLALAACALEPARPIATPIVVTAPAPVPAAAPTLATRLRALAVSDDDFYRRVLYTWTTPEAVTGVRATRQLLVATASSGTFVSPFNRVLAKLATAKGATGALAGLLATHPALVRRRYAWPTPFATVMGVGPRTYGNALIRIELRPQAWIARFDPNAVEPFAIVDAAGARVDPAAVLAEPERLAAIFHVRTEAAQSVRFREYVVCSAAMVASWSVATPAIRDELASEVELIRALRDWIDILPADETVLPASRAWARVPTSDDPATLWRAALAFDNRRYRLRKRQLDALLAALAAYDPAGPPLVVAP
jgi:hypothetical protein